MGALDDDRRWWSHDADWRHDELVCAVIDGEYENLKREYEDTFGSSDVPFLFRGSFTMWPYCMGRQGYIIQSDWEHHRMEPFGARMGVGYEAVLEYVVWHWDSIFARFAPQHQTPHIGRTFRPLVSLASVHL